MSFEVEVPDNVETQGGEFIEHVGWYLLAVEDVDDQIAGGFKVKMEALDGTVRNKENKFTEDGKTTAITLFNGKATQKNGGEFNRRRQSRFCIATGLLDESKAGQRVTINLQDAKNRLFIAKLAKTDDGKYMDFDFDHIYHIDDPKVAHVPRENAAKIIAAIPAQFRRKPESFASKKGGGPNGSSGGNSSGGANRPAVDPDEL